MDHRVDSSAATTHALHELMLSADSAEVFIQGLAYLAAETFSAGARVECGVTYQASNDSALTVASSSTSVVLMDETQYATGDGPCLWALRTGVLTDVQDTASDTRWRDFLGVVGHAGFRSVLGVSLWVGEEGSAVLNLYANEPGYFGPSVQESVRDFVRQGGGTLKMLVRGESTKRQVVDQHAAMMSRTAIDLAVGIIMGQNRCSQADAFSMLRDASNHQNMKLRVVAEHLIASLTTDPPATHFTTRAPSPTQTSHPPHP